MEAEGKLDEIATSWVGGWGQAWRRTVELHRTLGRPGNAPGDLRTNTSWRVRLLREAVAINPQGGFGDTRGKIARWESEDRANP
jgi:hypothetical protein